MRTYTDYNAWKTACRNRGWTGPQVVPATEDKSHSPTQHQFIDANGIQRATWDSSTNMGVIPDEAEPGQSA